MDMLLHLDEIMLKGANQVDFINQLRANLSEFFPSVPIRRIEGGLIMGGADGAILEHLALIPGIATFAPVIQTTTDLQQIEQALAKISFPSTVEKFRCTVTRSNKQYPLNSLEIAKHLGGIVEKTRGWKVSLKQFDLEIRIDIGRTAAWLYHDVRHGIGGLPTGISGRVGCLLSGGIDSPVAAFTMMKRGAEAVLIHFQNETAVTEEVSEKIIDLARTLSRFQPRVELYIIPFAEWQREIIIKVPAVYRMLITRRAMFKLAEKIAIEKGWGALATGDSLGQVASQTLDNLSVVHNAASMLKLTPLIGWNKVEIMALARRIGTLDISNRPYEDCCSLFVAKHPVTNAKLSVVEEIEGRLDFSIDDSLPVPYYTVVQFNS